MSKLTALLSLFLALTMSLGAFAQSRLEIFSLRHRSAQHILPKIKPFLSKQDKIVGQGQKIIVQTSTKNLQKIKKIVQILDTPATMLLISIWRGNNPHLLKRTNRIHTTATTAHQQQLQQICLESGYSARIQTGEAIPTIELATAPSIAGAPIAGVQYKTLESGMTLTPTVHGDRVHLNIKTQQHSLAREGGGRIQQQSLSTTLTVPFNQWVNIGGTARQERHRQTMVITQTNNKAQNSDIYIRVRKHPSQSCI